MFHINPDEPGQLAIARLFARRAPWDMLDHSTWRPGYGMLIAPLSWQWSDPVVAYRGALAVNAVLGGLSCLLLVWLAGRLLDVSPRRCAAVAAGVSLAPAVLFATDWAWSESLVQAVFLGFLVAAARFQETVSAASASTMVIAAAAGFATHSRLLVLSLVAAILIAIAGHRRRITRWHAAMSLSTLVVLLGVVELISDAVIERVWDDPGAMNSPGTVVSQLGSGLALVTSAAGQLWYQLVATLGVVGVGAVALAGRARRHGGPVERRAAEARIVLGTTAALFGLSVVFMAGRWRPDQVVYGRYTDAVIAPVLVVGVGWLLAASARSVAVALAGAATAIIVTGIAVEVTDQGQLRAPGLVRAMVVGLLPFIGGAPSIDIARTTALALGVLVALAVLRSLARGRRATAIVGLVVVALGVVGYTRTRSVVDIGLNSWSTAAAVRDVTRVVPAGEAVEVRMVPDAQAPSVSVADQRQRLTLYRFYLPDNPLVIDDPAAPGRRFTIAPIGDPAMVSRGARVVWRDPWVDLALWRDPSTGVAE